MSTKIEVVGGSRNGGEGGQWLLQTGLATNLFSDVGTNEGKGIGVQIQV